MTKEGFVPPTKEEEPEDLERLISDIKSGKSELEVKEQVQKLKDTKDRLKGSFRNPSVKRQIDAIDRILLSKEAEVSPESKKESEPSEEPASLESVLEEDGEKTTKKEDLGLSDKEKEGYEEYSESVAPSEKVEEKPEISEVSAEDKGEKPEPEESVAESAAQDFEDYKKKLRENIEEMTDEDLLREIKIDKSMLKAGEIRHRTTWLDIAEEVAQERGLDIPEEEGPEKAVLGEEPPEETEAVSAEREKGNQEEKAPEEEKTIPDDIRETYEKVFNSAAEEEVVEDINEIRERIDEVNRILENDTIDEEDRTKTKELLEKDREILKIAESCAQKRDIEVPEPPKEKKGLLKRFRESAVWKKLKGEQVTAEEMEQLSKKERAALIAGKVGDMASSALGIRIITRMPDRWLKRHYSKQEIKRIKAVSKEEEKLNNELRKKDIGEERKAQIEHRLQELGFGEGESRYNKVSRRMMEIEKRLEDSKYLSAEKRTQLQEKLSAIKDKWATDEKLLQSNLAEEVDTILNQYVGERTKKTDLVRDTVNLAAVSLGAYAIRAVGAGAFSLYDRHKRLKEEKGEGEKVSFFKETVYQGAIETAQEMFGQGKLKELEGKKKAVAVGATWAKGLLPVAITLMGYSEVAEKGGGAFTKAIERAQERAGEIGEAWEKVSQAGGLAKGTEVAKALLNTLNLQESIRRLTLRSAAKASIGKVEEASGTEGVFVFEGETLPKTEGLETGVFEGVTPSPEVTGTEELPTGREEIDFEEFGKGITAEATDTAKVDINKTLGELGVADSTAQMELAAKFAGSQEVLNQAKETFDAAGLSSEQSAEIIQGATSVEDLQDTVNQINTETALGVNSFEGGISEDELNNAVSELAGENREEADTLLANWQERGLVDSNEVAQLRFPIEHASLEHAGFQTEVADDKVNISLDLGKEGAPKYLEQVFYRTAIENTDLGEEITNVEGAQILNVGANLRELSEGHNIAGVSAEDFQKYVNVEGGKLAISDYEGFKTDVLDKLTKHSQEIITEENVADSGAVAYLDNIKKATWGDMVKPEGIVEEGIQLDQKMIDQAESRLFQATLEKSGKGELITEIKFTNEDTGTFNIFGETVSVRDGQVVSIGESQIENPFTFGNEAGGDRLIDEAARVRAEGLISKMEPREIDTFAQEYDISQDFDDTLDELGFKGRTGPTEWEFLRDQSTDDLLNKDIEGRAGRVGDWMYEQRHRGKLGGFIQEAIDQGMIKSPSEGGPEIVEDTVKEILQVQAREQAAAELDTADRILASSEKLTEEGEKAFDTLEQDVSKLVTVGAKGKGTFSLTIEQIRSEEGEELLKTSLEADGGYVGRAAEIKKEVNSVIEHSEGVSQKQPLARLLEHHTEDETVKSAVTGFRPEVTPEVAPPPETPAAEATTVVEEAPETVPEEPAGTAAVEEAPKATPPETTPETVEAGPGAEGERLNTFTTPEGHRIDFQYNEKGELTNLSTHGYMRGFPESLNDNYREAVREAMSGKGAQETLKAISAVEAQSRYIDLERNILHSMEEAGKSDAPEAVFLRQSIENSVQKIEEHYGDVFKEIPAAGIESAPIEEGLESDTKAAPETTPIPETAEVKAMPEEIDLALGNLAGGIEGVDKLSLEDINKLDDTTALTKLKEGAEEVLKQIKENPPKETDPDSLGAVSRGYQHILGAIDTRLKELQ